MRKTLIMTLILVLIIVIVKTVLSSFSLGGFNIPGIKDLNSKNKELDSSIQNLSKLSSVEYQKALTDVSDSAKTYTKSRDEYNQLAEVSTSNELSSGGQLQKYEIEYLWTRIGAHATKENVVLKLEVAANASSSATGYYDLNFAVTGSYVSITDFIYDVENDSSLGFKIENFKMTSGSATFTCKNISINIDPSEIASGENENSENTNSNTTSENTTNSNTTSGNTTGNSTTNTTNTTNTTSTNTTSTNTN